MDETKRQTLFWVAMIVAALIIGVLGTMLFLTESSMGREASPTTIPPTRKAVEELIPPKPEAATPTKKKMTDKERLDAAVSAVFGNRGMRSSETDDFGGAITETPAQLIDTPFGPILLTKRATTSDCHACAGFIGGYYLKENGNSFEVTAEYPELLADDWGQVPEGWLLTRDYTRYPALFYEGFGMGQGYSESSAIIVELTPKGPRTSFLGMGESNSGAVESTDSPDYYSNEGKIVNVVRGKSLDVQFSGTCSDVQKYQMTKGVFEPVGKIACERE